MLLRWAGAGGAAFWTAMALLVVAGSGCGHKRSYCATNLPLEFAAPPSVNVESVNLAGLATPTAARQAVQPGDVLDVSMVTDFNKLTATITPVRVADDGSVTVPLIGKVHLAGLELEQAEEEISSAGVARGIFRQPCITVTMKQQRTNKITVVGAVKQPGVYELPRGASSLMAALVAAGGLAEEAGPDVEVRGTVTQSAPRPPLLERTAGAGGGEAQLTAYHTAAPITPVKINLLAAEGAAEAKTREVRDGDVVHVPKRQLLPVHVLGLVHKPGEFPYPPKQEMRLLDAVALAGGTSHNLADKVLVVRQIPGQPQPVNIALSLQEAATGPDNVTLAPGDTVKVEQTPATMFTDTLRDFFRIGFSAALPVF